MKFDTLKKNIDYLKQHFSKLKTSAELLTKHNLCLSKYNKGLFIKLNTRRLAYKEEMQNILLLIFESMRTEHEDLMCSIRELLYTTKILTKKENKVLERATAFSDLIPLIIKKIIEDANTKNEFLYKFISFFEFKNDTEQKSKEKMLLYYQKRLLKNKKDTNRLLKQKHRNSHSSWLNSI